MDGVRKILVVDDEAQITRVLRRSLLLHYYRVRIASDGLAALDTFYDWKPDLIITDLQMPEMDGLRFICEVRKVSETPIIVLSVRGDENAKIEALDAGADDFITKPFSFNELIARVRANIRRLPETETKSEFKVGDFIVNLRTRRVFVRGEEVKLTPTEFDLLVYLVRHPEKVLTHRTLLAAVWGGNPTKQSEYLRVYFGNLRKKIEKDPSKPKYIITEPWVGYRFNPAA